MGPQSKLHSKVIALKQGSKTGEKETGSATFFRKSKTTVSCLETISNLMTVSSLLSLLTLLPCLESFKVRESLGWVAEREHV